LSPLSREIRILALDFLEGKIFTIKKPQNFQKSRTLSPCNLCNFWNLKKPHSSQLVLCIGEPP